MLKEYLIIISTGTIIGCVLTILVMNIDGILLFFQKTRYKMTLTDHEIIKAYKYCADNKMRNCKTCVYNSLNCNQLDIDVIDLLERQQTEIKVLSQKRINLAERLNFVKNAKLKTVKKFEEKLKFKIKDVSFNNTIRNDLCTYIDDIVKEIIDEVTK